MSTYERATEVFADFLPVLVKLQATVSPSSDENYWRSRWHEWVNPHSEDKKAEFERKRQLQLIWKEVWYHFNFVFCQKVKIPDRLILKTHLVSSQQMADKFVAFIRQQEQRIDEPQNTRLWYLRYSHWNNTVHYGGLATECLWPATWPLIQRELERMLSEQPPLKATGIPLRTAQLSLFNTEDYDL